MKFKLIRLKIDSKPWLVPKQIPACRTLVPGPDLLQMLQRHLEEKTVDQLDSTELVQLERKLESLLRGARIRKEVPPPPENLMMENELSAITNLQNQQQQEEDVGEIRNQQIQQQQQQQLLLMGMHLNNYNNGGFIPIHQLQVHQHQQQQHQLFLMGMHLNNASNNNNNNNNNNDGSASAAAVATSAVPLLQRDAFQKGILHFF